MTSNEEASRASASFRQLFGKLLPDGLSTVTLDKPLPPNFERLGWRLARDQLATALLRGPESRNPMYQSLPSLRQRSEWVLFDTGWIGDALPVNRSLLYKTLLGHFVEAGRWWTWGDLGSSSILELHSSFDLLDQTMVAVAEMVIDFVAAADRKVKRVHVDVRYAALDTSSEPPTSVATMPDMVSSAAIIEPEPTSSMAPSPLVAGPLSPATPSDALVGEAINRLLGTLDERTRDIFVARVLQQSPETLQEIGDRYGVTRERIRQIEHRSAHALRKLLQNQPAYALVKQQAETLLASVGSVAPQQHPYLQEVLTEIFGWDWTPEQVAFLFWAAGPYTLENGLWTHEQRWNPQRARAALDALASDAGLSLVELQEAMANLGCLPMFAEEVARTSLRVESLLDRYFIGNLTIPEKCLAALHHAGEPLTVEQMLERTGMTNPARSVTNALQADEQFVRTSRQHYALRSWGLEEYGGISEAIRNAIVTRGGIASVQELMAEISTTYGVRAMSVRQYAQAPMFVLEGDRVRLRRPDEPYTYDLSSLPSKRSFYRYGRRVVLFVDVNDETLRGSGTAIAPDIAVALGALPEAPVRYVNPGASLCVTWPRTSGLGATLGSLREPCRLHGAQVGDRLRLTFDRDNGMVEYASISSAFLNDLPPLARVRVLTGIDDSNPKHIERRLDEALEYPLAGVVAVLRNRGDRDLADALEEVLSTATSA